MFLMDNNFCAVTSIDEWCYISSCHPNPPPTPPPVSLGAGRCEEGIHKNRRQILPAAEAGRAAQDGHGQSHRPLFVRGWEGMTTLFAC